MCLLLLYLVIVLPKTFWRPKIASCLQQFTKTQSFPQLNQVVFVPETNQIWPPESLMNCHLFWKMMIGASDIIMLIWVILEGTNPMSSPQACQDCLVYQICSHFNLFWWICASMWGSKPKSTFCNLTEQSLLYRNCTGTSWILRSYSVYSWPNCRLHCAFIATRQLYF